MPFTNCRAVARRVHGMLPSCTRYVHDMFTVCARYVHDVEADPSRKRIAFPLSINLLHNRSYRNCLVRQ